MDGAALLAILAAAGRGDLANELHFGPAVARKEPLDPKHPSFKAGHPARDALEAWFRANSPVLCLHRR